MMSPTGSFFLTTGMGGGLTGSGGIAGTSGGCTGIVGLGCCTGGCSVGPILIYILQLLFDFFYIIDGVDEILARNP
jgi:hypothetical protein